MGLSLFQSAQLAENNGEFKKAGVLRTFGETSPLLAAIPRVQIQGNSYGWTREVSLGSVATRAVGSGYTPNNGTVETRTVGIKAMGGELDVDNLLIQAHGAQIRSQHEQMKTRVLAQTIAHKLIKGSVTTAGGATADANGIDGLQVRYGGGFGSTAVVDAGENATQIIANTGASDALSMRDLDLAIQAVENPTHLLMTKAMKVNINAFLRGSSSITQTKDEFGRLVTVYNGMPILEADMLGTVSGLEQLGFNENNDSTTSVYVLSLTDMGCYMVQLGDIQVRDLGEQNALPVWRTRIELYANLVDAHPRCVARLYNIANLTAVA